MLRIHDGRVTVNGLEMTVDEFYQLRSEAPALPAGMITLNYDGAVRSMSTGSKQHNWAGSWQAGDDILADAELVDELETLRNPPAKLAFLKSEKKQDFISEALGRITAHAAELGSIEMLRLLALIWPGLNVTTLPSSVKEAKEIYFYLVIEALPRVSSALDKEVLAAMNPALDSPFGAAAPSWPT